jgi:hypothetical protein
MKSCLSQQELANLLEYKMEGCIIDEESLASRIALAESWTEPIGAITYLLARITESQGTKGYDCNPIIDCFYNMVDSMYFKIQELDPNFISCLVQTLRDSANTLEEELVDLQDKILNHNYAHIIRY